MSQREQLSFFGGQAPKQPWQQVYARKRADGSKITVAITPSRDAVAIRSAGKAIYLRPSEVGPIGRALLVALEEVA